MFFPIVVFAQLAATPVYSSADLRDIVAKAVTSNREPPAEFRGYGARVETELSLILRDTLGREGAAQIEQLASSVHWTRGGEYLMHVVGYRSQSAGPIFSALSFLRGWSEPSLYGDRILFGAQFQGNERRRASHKSSAGVVTGVHPFAADREEYYRYSGGDTVTVLRSPGRAIPVIRIHVTPHIRDSTRLAAFSGEIDLDATRYQIVRMRGQFVVLGKAKGRAALISKLSGLVAVAYCEFVNAEIDGKYWIPSFQRTEFQTSFVLLARNRAVMRIVSRFRDYSIDDTATIAYADTGGRIPHRVTWAPSDSVSAFGKWATPLGEATTSVSADDFDDVGPETWRATGRAEIDIAPTNFDNLVRYNRIEGLYTGVETNVRLRSSAPGLTLGGTVGWAWTERTIRGGAHAALKRRLWTYAAGAERALAAATDFPIFGESPSNGINGLFASFDDFDYVDRRTTLVSVTHVMRSLDRGLVTLHLGGGSDRTEVRRLAHGPIGGGSFRPNRGITPGSYALAVLDAELHPSASADFVQPGFGARLHYEIGHGGLDWQRVELRVSGREYWGPVAIGMDANGGAVVAKRIPPQQLFELGGSLILPGYEYKEFAGDRAALFRSFANYTFPLWRAPHKVWRTLMIPGVAPGIGAGFQGGWTEISNSAARQAVEQLGTGWSATPVSRATGGIRATFGVGVTLFSGNGHIGVARPVDHPAPWKFVAGFGTSF